MSAEEAKDQQEAGKEARKFENYYKKLVALLGGPTLIKKRGKLAKDDVLETMQELIKEKKEAKIAEIKQDVKNLIEDKIAYDDFKAAQQKAFEKIVEEKQKEFNKKAEAVFSKIDGIDELEAKYYAALKSASTPSGTTGQEEVK